MKYGGFVAKKVVKNCIFLTVTSSRRLAAFSFSSSVLGSFTFISSSSLSCFKMWSIYSWWNNEKEQEAGVFFADVDLRGTRIEKRVCRSNGHTLLLSVLKASSMNLGEWVI